MVVRGCSKIIDDMGGGGGCKLCGAHTITFMERSLCGGPLLDTIFSVCPMHLDHYNESKYDHDSCIMYSYMCIQ